MTPRKTRNQTKNKDNKTAQYTATSLISLIFLAILTYIMAPQVTSTAVSFADAIVIAFLLAIAVTFASIVEDFIDDKLGTKGFGMFGELVIIIGLSIFIIGSLVELVLAIKLTMVLELLLVTLVFVNVFLIKGINAVVFKLTD